MKPIEELTFTDDYMFGHVLRNPDICKELLERLLHIKIEKVEFPELQKTISNFYESKGIRLDVYVKDSDKIFDIEIQNNSEINLPRRTRYYQSMLDMDNLLKGEDYDNLKESFIIFLCQFDPFSQNLPCYTFVNICREDKSLELKDGTTKVFFNSTAYSQEQDVEISALLRYISTKIPTDDFTSRVNSIVESSKNNEKFRSEYLAMNLHDRDIKVLAYKDGMAEGKKVGLAEGREAGLAEGEKNGRKTGQLEAKIETAKNLLAKNIPVEVVIECTGLPIEEVEKLLEK